jgi:hypothetical protein
LTYSPMHVGFDNLGFPMTESKIHVGEYYFILPFLYEVGAILGRSRPDKINVLKKMLFTADQDLLRKVSFTMDQVEANIDKVIDKAEGRLGRYKQESRDREPETFDPFIMVTEHQSHTLWCSLKPKAKVSPSKVEPYILSFILEGIAFGSIYPELTRKMNRKFYESVKIDWATWMPVGVSAPLALPKDIYALPGEPTILSLEGQEQTLLQVVGWYTANFYPELINSLDLRDYQDTGLEAWDRYRGWWLIYESLLFSDK